MTLASVRFLPLCLMVLVALAINLGADLRAFDATWFAGIDKPLHFLLWGACGAAAVVGFRRTPAKRVITIVATIAIAEELSQSLFPHRSLDGWDVVASCGGVVLCGIVAARLWPRGSELPRRRA